MSHPHESFTTLGRSDQHSHSHRFRRIPRPRIPGSRVSRLFQGHPGHGHQGTARCVCPYCEHSGENNTFFTQEQIEYARSVAIRKITDAVHADLKSLEFEHKPRGMFGIGVSMKVSRSAPQPIRYYRERELETHVVCDHCTLRYAIYGVFAWCP